MIHKKKERAKAKRNEFPTEKKRPFPVEKRREFPIEKFKMHARNRHRERYDFKVLIEACPELAQFVKMNVHNDESIDFFDPEAVKTLNRALLKQYYEIGFWDIPPRYLCPPIPGRADYIHHIAELLGTKNGGKTPTGTQIKCLDIGVGANCVYPIIGNKEYGWSFIGSDIDKIALESAAKIIEMNPVLEGKIELRLQENPKEIFFGIIQEDEKIDLTICNPPFHASLKEAQAGTLRKVYNLTDKKISKPILNFGGQSTELWCEGGEARFVGEMVRQSKYFAASVLWFSTLVSKQTHLKNAFEALKTAGASEVKTIPMGQGNKSSRLVAWTFFTKIDREKWVEERWGEENV